MDYTPAPEAQDPLMSKRERRQARRDEARGDVRKAALRRLVRRILLWTAAAGVLAGIVFAVWHAAKSIPIPGTAGGDLSVPVGEGDNIKGPADASATLVEYSDFQCPACGSFYPVLKQLFADSKDKVRFVYRNFPLKSLHPNAELAAHAAQAAALQGKFWEMHDKLFEGQAKWSGMSGTGAREVFLGYAGELGLDKARMDKDMDGDAVKSKVQSDVDGGNRAGVNSTPTFYLNGKKLTGFRSVDEFRAAVLSAIPRATVQ